MMQATTYSDYPYHPAGFATALSGNVVPHVNMLAK